MCYALLTVFGVFIAEVDFYESNEIGAAKSCELLTNIIDCLYKCMLHDNDGLFQKDIFKVVMQPLVDQVCYFHIRNFMKI